MTLARRLAAEAIGTAALLMVVVGSGIMAAELSGGNAAIALLANALATGFGLFVLITLFAPLSGAHFNPLVSAVAWVERTIDTRTFVAYAATQVSAAICGTWLAHAMFDLQVFELGIHRRTGNGQWLSELIATMGLMLVVSSSRSRRFELVAALVGAYIAAAYWFTASTSFANPAVTLARSLTTTFAGIAPIDVPAFILVQSLGTAIACAAGQYLWPRPDEPDVEKSPPRR